MTNDWVNQLENTVDNFITKTRTIREDLNTKMKIIEYLGRHIAELDREIHDTTKYKPLTSTINRLTRDLQRINREKNSLAAILFKFESNNPLY